jgi:hypothetical protein
MYHQVKRRIVMRKIKFIIPCIVVLFYACNKSDNPTQSTNTTPSTTPVAKYAGVWRGTTSQSRPLFIHVNGNDEIDSISVEMRVYFGSASCVYQFSNSNLIPVVNDTFTVEIFSDIGIPSGSHYPILHGILKNNTTFEGTISQFSAAGGICGGSFIFGTGYTNSSQTWSATRDSINTNVTATLEGNPWKANKFRGSGSQIDVSADNWVYTYNNGNGILKANGVVMGNGFTYSINADQITISGASEEYLPDGTYYYWILNNAMYFNETATIATGSYPLIEFLKQ